MNVKRVVVTGMEVVTPLGVGLNFGPKKVSPMAVINLSANTAAGEVARIFNAKGPHYFYKKLVLLEQKL
jgi:3-oxoacyl-(acyl-carrier-protein) synthase